MSGMGAALLKRRGRLGNACSAFSSYIGIAVGRVGVVGRLRQGPTRRSRSGRSARAQRRYRSGGPRRASGPARPGGAARPGRPTLPKRSGDQIGLCVRLHRAMPGRRGAGDGLLRAHPQSSAIPRRTRCVMRSGGFGVQYPIGRGMCRIAEIARNCGGGASAATIFFVKFPLLSIAFCRRRVGDAGHIALNSRYFA